RRGWLASKLRLSVRELLLLISQTGLDPFNPSRGADPLDLPPTTLEFVALVQKLTDGPLTPNSALYLICNQDLSGVSAPPDEDVTELAESLRNDFAAIDDEFRVLDHLGDDMGRARQAAIARLAAVYGQDVSERYIKLLESTPSSPLPLQVPYQAATGMLDPAVLNVDPQLSYDNVNKLLLQQGLLTSYRRDALKLVPTADMAFKAAVDALFALSQEAMRWLLVIDAPYTDPNRALAPGIVAVDDFLRYDDLSKRLSHAGLLMKPD